MKSIRVLFVTWDGEDSNYLPSLFVPLFRALKERGVMVSVLQFGTGHFSFEQSRTACERAGIPFEGVPVMRGSQRLSSLLMIIEGARRILKYEPVFDVVMPRSLIPAAMVLAAARLGLKKPVCFDADGLMADERVEYGQWSADSLNYRIFRRVEYVMVRTSNAILVRSEPAREILVAREGPTSTSEKFFTIYNGREEDSFFPADSEARRNARLELGFDEGVPVIAYVGSVGEKYRLDLCAKFVKIVRATSPEAEFLVLTRQKTEARSIIGPVRAKICAVEPQRVPNLLRAADVGLLMLEGSFSLRAVSPIKIGEYLMCGVPVLLTQQIGDLNDHGLDEVTRVLADTSTQELGSAADWFLKEVMSDRPTLRDICNRVGTNVFGMTACVDTVSDALQFALSQDSSD